MQIFWEKAKPYLIVFGFIPHLFEVSSPFIVSYGNKRILKFY